MELQGSVHKYGDHVDTDVIIPAHLLNNPDPAVLAQHCMEVVDPDFSKTVKEGDIIVAGLNFGCGSSREHAPVAIRAAGISCVIAQNFARIFFRNSIDIGLPVLECPQAAIDAQSGDVIKVNLDNGQIDNITQGKTYQAVPFPPFMQNLIESGGLVNFTKEKLNNA